MPKCFPKLTQNTVRVEVAEGRSLMLPMLPVSCLSELHECSADLNAAATLEDAEAVRRRLIRLVGTVIPPEYAGNLDRFPLTVLAELAAYLMFGDDDDQARPEPEKN